MQSETEQRPHNVSFYVDTNKAQTVTNSLSEMLTKQGIRFKLWIMNMAKYNLIKILYFILFSFHKILISINF